MMEPKCPSFVLKKGHQEALRRVSGKSFFRERDSFASIFKTLEELEERYMKYERKK